MKKLRVFIDMKQEENYLNKMAEQGWAVVDYSLWHVYTFEKISPKPLNYRIDFQTFKKKKDYIDYLTLFEDSGWQPISSRKNSGFHFFLPQKNTSQNSEIFSDTISSNERYKRLYNHATFWGILTIFYLFLLQPSFKNIASWYLAPTIWTFKGLQLFGMIFMQTFFVLLQLLPMIFFLVLTIYYVMIGTQSKKLFQKNNTEL